MDIEYVVAENLRFGGQITQISNLRYVDVIMQNYNNHQLNKFKNSCFSYFEYLQGRRLQFSGKLVHEFLLNAIHTNKSNELWFKINGQLVRFGIQEYCLILGLLCHNIDENLTTVKTLEKHKLRRRWFNNATRISLNELENGFINCDHEGDKYKLGLALLIEGVLKPKERKKINIETLSLVDNLDVCYEYPWGRHSFFTLLHSLLTSWERRAAKATDKSGEILQYTIYGFPLAFQIWIYESCPQVGQIFGRKIKNTFPRILNWDAEHRISKKAIDDFFKSNEVVILPTLKPTGEEVEQQYFYTMVLLDDAVDSRFDAVVHQFEYGGQDQIGEQLEQVNQQDIVEPSVLQGYGNVDDYHSWSPYISNEPPMNNWPAPNVSYMDYAPEQNIPTPEDSIPEMPSGEYEQYDDYVTNAHLSSLFAEQRVYIDHQLSSQRSYFDHELASIRDEFMHCFDQLESYVSSSSKKMIDDKYKEMQQYVDTKFTSFQAEQSSLFGGLQDDLHREMHNFLVHIQGMFDGMKVDNCTIGGNQMEYEAVPVNPMVHDEDQGRRKNAPSSSSSIDIPILCDVDK